MKQTSTLRKYTCLFQNKNVFSKMKPLSFLAPIAKFHLSQAVKNGYLWAQNEGDFLMLKITKRLSHLNRLENQSEKCISISVIESYYLTPYNII